MLFHSITTKHSIIFINFINFSLFHGLRLPSRKSDTLWISVYIFWGPLWGKIGGLLSQERWRNQYSWIPPAIWPCTQFRVQYAVLVCSSLRYCTCTVLPVVQYKYRTCTCTAYLYRGMTVTCARSPLPCSLPPSFSSSLIRSFTLPVPVRSTGTCSARYFFQALIFAHNEGLLSCESCISYFRLQ